MSDGSLRGFNIVLPTDACSSDTVVQSLTMFETFNAVFFVMSKLSSRVRTFDPTILLERSICIDLYIVFFYSRLKRLILQLILKIHCTNTVPILFMKILQIFRYLIFKKL